MNRQIQDWPIWDKNWSLGKVVDRKQDVESSWFQNMMKELGDVGTHNVTYFFLCKSIRQ